MPCIVHSQAFLQILCYARIVMLAGSNIAENIDVMKRALHGEVCIVYRL